MKLDFLVLGLILFSSIVSAADNVYLIRGNADGSSMSLFKLGDGYDESSFNENNFAEFYDNSGNLLKIFNFNVLENEFRFKVSVPANSYRMKIKYNSNYIYDIVSETPAISDFISRIEGDRAVISWNSSTNAAYFLSYSYDQSNWSYMGETKSKTLSFPSQAFAGGRLYIKLSAEKGFLSSEATASVDIPDNSPTARIIYPIQDDIYFENEAVYVRGIGYDLEGATTLNWKFDGNFVSSNNSFFIGNLSVGKHKLELIVTDSANQAATDSVEVIVPYYVDNCAELNLPNTYYVLNNSVVPLNTCFNITASGVTLDCNGYSISNTTLAATGIYSNQLNTTIKNCNVTLKIGVGQGIGIQLYGAHNSYIFNNTLNSQNIGLYMVSTSNATIENNIMNSNTNYGLDMKDGSNNNKITGLTTNSNGYGILLASSSNNNIADITSNGNTQQGISILYNSNNNIAQNITANSNTKYGIYVYYSSNNVFNSGTVSSSIANIYLQPENYGSRSSSNNVFRNLILSNPASSDVSSPTLFSSTGANINNTFLNVTYNSGKESIASGHELIREWYYQANVSDTAGNIVSGANVTAFNVFGAYEMNLTTDSTGLTGLGILTDYVNNGGTRNYYSDYTIYAGKLDYPAENHTYNSSLGNNYNDLFILSDVSSNSYTAPPKNKAYNANVSVSNFTNPGTGFILYRPDNNASEKNAKNSLMNKIVSRIKSIINFKK